MKTKLFLPILFVTCISFFACTKTDLNEASANQQLQSSNLPPGQASNSSATSLLGVPNCPPTVVTLIAGQTIDAGQVTVWNDDDFMYVTYSTANGYYLAQTHLYVGNASLIPLNNPGNPIPGQFPYGATHNNAGSYTYQLPHSVMGSGNFGCVAAHAVLVKLGANGNIIEQQTGWGNGTRINLNGGNWGMRFNYNFCIEGGGGGVSE